MLVKIHESYRKIVAICDSELIGKKFEDEKRQLHIKESFYAGERMDEEQVIEIIKDAAMEDANFNLVGIKAINAGLKAGIIEKKGIVKIQGIPHALILL